MQYGYVSAPPPGEFERHAALIVSLTELLAHSPQTVIEIVDGVIERVPLIAIVRGEEQRRHAITMLTDWGIPAHGVHFVFMPVGTWTRDFAPSFVRWWDGTTLICDHEYAFEGRANEDVVAAALAALLRVPRRRVPLVLEGGNLLSNGAGLGVSTTALVEVNRLHGRGYDATRVCELLGEHYGLSQVVLLEPLLGHRTLHVDNFVTFAGPDVAVVAAGDARRDPETAALLDRNAAALAQVRTRGGRPLRVERIPMPPYGGDACRSYTNVIYANGAVLVPHYPGVDGGLEREVLLSYGRLLPGWDVLQVDCGPLLQGQGGLRCLSAHVPWLHDRFDEAGKPATRRRRVYAW